MEEVRTNMSEGGLSAFADGYIGFHVKAKDTDENRSVHNEFRLFCQRETGNNYTKGLSLLLNLSQFDFKYELLYNELHRLNIEIAHAKAEIEYLAEKLDNTDKKEVPIKEDGTTF